MSFAPMAMVTRSVSGFRASYCGVTNPNCLPAMSSVVAPLQVTSVRLAPSFSATTFGQFLVERRHGVGSWFGTSGPAAEESPRAT